MRKVLAAAVVLMVLIPVTASAGGGGHFDACAGYAGGSELLLLDSCFHGTAHFAAIGSTIVVRNGGGLPHDYTAVDGSFASGHLNPGETFEFEVDEPGVYEVFCSLHGSNNGEGMAGVLIVGEPEELAITAPASLDAVRDAVSQGNAVVTEALESHAVMIAGLTSSHARLVDELKAATVAGQPTAPVAAAPDTATPWLFLVVGVTAGLAAAAVGLATADRWNRRSEATPGAPGRLQTD